MKNLYFIAALLLMAACQPVNKGDTKSKADDSLCLFITNDDGKTWVKHHCLTRIKEHHDTAVIECGKDTVIRVSNSSFKGNVQIGNGSTMVIK